MAENIALDGSELDFISPAFSSSSTLPQSDRTRVLRGQISSSSSIVTRRSARIKENPSKTVQYANKKPRKRALAAGGGGDEAREKSKRMEGNKVVSLPLNC
jgi:hypothetical protein